MKKVLLAIAVVAMIGLASCSKSKTCICKYTIMGVQTEVEVTDQKTCDLDALPGVDLPSGVTFTCTEK